MPTKNRYRYLTKLQATIHAYPDAETPYAVASINQGVEFTAPEAENIGGVMWVRVDIGYIRADDLHVEGVIPGDSGATLYRMRSDLENAIAAIEGVLRKLKETK